MKKILFGIFAHPDDEAFGPAGTLLGETKNGTDLHLVSLTAGENGMNPDNHKDLAAVRLEEWRHAGALLGATRLHHLGYTDGMLGNIAFLEIVERIEALVRDVLAHKDAQAEVEFMSMDTNGVTGHIDHIVASRAAHYVFYKLKQAGLPLTRLRLSCIPRAQTGDDPNLDFVFMEPGRTSEEIDEVVHTQAYLDEIYAVMRAHHTQRHDGETHIRTLGQEIATNYFIVKR